MKYGCCHGSIGTSADCLDDIQGILRLVGVQERLQCEQLPLGLFNVNAVRIQLFELFYS